LATVLVIEDDPVILDNTLEILDLEGYKTIGAGDGCEGVQRAEQYSPDIIVCDVLMPKLDGYGVLKALRSNPSTIDIPLIFVSATPREDILAATTKLGASGYLIKPFRAVELLNVIQKLLHKGQGD
jgi:CheY-like chemotaxis protein